MVAGHGSRFLSRVSRVLKKSQVLKKSRVLKKVACF